MCYCAQLYVGPGDMNLDPHAHTTGLLPTEPSSRPGMLVLALTQDTSFTCIGHLLPQIDQSRLIAQNILMQPVSQHIQGTE